MEPIEDRIGYQFRDSRLLSEALTHPSVFSDAAHPDNQRLEFLGDAVLQLVITEELFHRFPGFPEGRLTKLRSRLVSRRALADFALRLGLGAYIRLGKSENTSTGRSRPSTLADVFEALIGAIYLDSDLASVRTWVLASIATEMQVLATSPEEVNPKGQLQEILQAIAPEAPLYRILSESGPDHARVFLAEVTWQGGVLGTGEGNSKKEAEIRAASEALIAKRWNQTGGN